MNTPQTDQLLVETTQPLLTLKGVTRCYPLQQVEALQGVSLSIESGAFVALMGPSGCGKSTLLNLIGCMDLPTSGEIWLNGQNLGTSSEETLVQIRQAELGFIFQFFNLLSTLTVAENVALPLELMGQPPQETRQRVAELLEKVHLSHRSSFYPGQLSGGEMQRVAIARALIHNPRLIIADEPTGNLDSENGTEVLQLLKSLTQSSGQTVVMATHSEEAAQYADRIIRIRDGRILSDTGGVTRG